MSELKGKTIVFTGKLEQISLGKAEAQAKALGAKVGSSITKDTDLLVAGLGAGSKFRDAKKLGVKVIDEDAWVTMAGVQKSRIAAEGPSLPRKKHESKQRYIYFVSFDKSDSNEGAEPSPRYLEENDIDDFDDLSEEEQTIHRQKSDKFVLSALNNLIKTISDHLIIRTTKNVSFDRKLTDEYQNRMGILLTAEISLAESDHLFAQLSEQIDVRIIVEEYTTMNMQAYEQDEYDTGTLSDRRDDYIYYLIRSKRELIRNNALTSDEAMAESVAEDYDHNIVIEDAARYSDLAVVTAEASAGGSLSCALFGACSSGESKAIAVIDQLFAMGVDVNKPVRNGETALMAAARQADSESGAQVVQMLVDRGADVNAATDSGDTPLLGVAGCRGERIHEVVKVLIDQGANINAVTKNGDTCAIRAAGAGQYAVLKMLSEMGADLRAANKAGTTPLIAAAESPGWRTDGVLRTVEYILSQGVDVNAASLNGRTALMAAAENMSPLFKSNLVKCLLEHGADPDRVDSQGKKALELIDDEEIKREFIKRTSK